MPDTTCVRQTRHTTPNHGHETMTINFYHSNREIVETLIRFLNNRNIEFTKDNSVTISVDPSDKDTVLRWCDNHNGASYLGLIYLGLKK